MIPRSAFVFLGLFISTLACTVTTQVPTPTVAAQSYSQSPIVTATPRPSVVVQVVTATPVPPVSPTLVPTLISTICVPNTAWPVYIVQPGDTLSALASRTSSTVDALAAANCITNPDRIDANQVLYVPQTPANAPALSVVNATCPIPDIEGIGWPMVYPYNEFNGRCYELQSGMTVTVNWPEVPAGTGLVVFYLLPINSTTPFIIGIDNVMWDGAAVAWQVEPTGYAYLYAAADNTSTMSSPQVVYTQG